jgi:SnoaL-like domain
VNQPAVIETWHRLVRSRDTIGLKDLLAEDAVFHSPVLDTPQRGKKLAFLYLAAAFKVFNDSFRYVREVVDGNNAVLEFEAELDGIVVNGIDMITWNDQGQITDFKVMVRPLKAINLIQQKMEQMLEALK